MDDYGDGKAVALRRDGTLHRQADPHPHPARRSRVVGLRVIRLYRGNA